MFRRRSPRRAPSRSAPCPRAPRAPVVVLCLAALLASTACDDKKPGPPPSGSPPAVSTPSAVAVPASAPLPVAAPSASAGPLVTIICQHVLIAYKTAKKPMRGITRTRDEARTRAEEIRNMARKDPDEFDDLVKRYSDDYSKERAGTTGRFKREDMVKPFSDAAFALRPGEVSDIVETPFGFHVIKRNE